MKVEIKFSLEIKRTPKKKSPAPKTQSQSLKNTVIINHK